MRFLPPLGTTYSSPAAFKLDVLERAVPLGMSLTVKSTLPDRMCELACPTKVFSARCSCRIMAKKNAEKGFYEVVKVENRHSCSKEDRRRIPVRADQQLAARIENLKQEVPKEERKRMKRIRKSEKEQGEKKKAARANAKEEKDSTAALPESVGQSSSIQEEEVAPSAVISNRSTSEGISGQSSIPHPPSLPTSHSPSHFDAFVSLPVPRQPLHKPSHRLASQATFSPLHSTALSSFVQSFASSLSVTTVALGALDSLGISDIDTLTSILMLDKTNYERFVVSIHNSQTKSLLEDMRGHAKGHT